jgi:hypothetical protein
VKAGSALPGFILRTLAWLPACFAVWYFAAGHHAAVAGTLARWLANLLETRIVEAVVASGTTLVFATTIEMRTATGQSGALMVEVNPLLYTYGLAFLAALMLAARASWWKLLAGAAALLPFQAWGIAFDFLSQAAITLGPEVAARSGITGWRVEAIALGYQAGALLLPALMPVLVWALVCRWFVERQLLRPAAA